MKKWLIIAACLTILSGCGTKQLISDPVVIPADLTQACDPIPPLKFNAKMTDLVTADVNLIQQYKTCAAKQAALAAAVK